MRRIGLPIRAVRASAQKVRCRHVADPLALVFDFTPSNQIASFGVADEVSSDDRTRRVLNRLISSIVSFAEDLHIAVVRLTIVELRNGGAICVQGGSDRAGAVLLFDRGGKRAHTDRRY